MENSAFILRERFEVATNVGSLASGTYGLAEEVVVLTSATNPSGAVELVVLDVELEWHPRDRGGWWRVRESEATERRSAPSLDG